ncbi:glycosyltransferase family 69 protein [Postia placenta MAD-698-R-SB12]|uniref:Glycosyltransferase family 69 protein n=1 Tax=Postia placenta MAD-698-R-SB12 TaxID=670580 RepID=A0A1X6N776_9APHY|nr:glycosyltransferase family 69 protein [Postia placenta MAD-698-R-SB12]OSX64461.1 glycosyltransferase family 69 protein [Postia placenta MAD-698-R-SB12]
MPSSYWRPWWNGPHVVRVVIRILRLPFLLPFISFLVITDVLEGRWCAKFGRKDIWQPAFPLSFRLWSIALLAATINAGIWLCWMLVWEAVVWCLKRRNSRGWRSPRQNGNPRYSDDEGEGQYILLPDGERPSMSSPPMSPTRRSRIRRAWNMQDIWWWAQVVLYASIALVGVWETKHYEHPNDRALSDRHPSPEGCGKGEKIFIAASFFNNQDVLPYWTSTLLAVITYLGPANVFVSIVESHSSDNTPALLTTLADTLAARGVPHQVLVHDDAAVPKPDDLSFNNRIEFLARTRNRALEPLVRTGGYARVLFSNDVLVEPESVLELLDTHDGEYDMACAMDFGHFGAYDAWVLRDRLGHLTSSIWPYFIDAPSIDLMRKDAPVPVFSCWNGMVVFDADPLLPIHLRSNRTLSRDPLPSPLPPTHPAAHDASLRGPSPALTPPIAFRWAQRELGECFSSESFLLPYDLRTPVMINLGGLHLTRT